MPIRHLDTSINPSSTVPLISQILTSTITLMNCSTVIFNGTTCDVITINGSNLRITRRSYSLLNNSILWSLSSQIIGVAKFAPSTIYAITHRQHIIFMSHVLHSQYLMYFSAYISIAAHSNVNIIHCSHILHHYCFFSISSCIPKLSFMQLS